MVSYCYILYSQTIDKYYVGHTTDHLDIRIKKHNTHHKGFTGGLGDWKLAYKEEFESKIEAIKREKEIKKQKIEEVY